jgi:hypothetical protein
VRKSFSTMATTICSCRPATAATARSPATACSSGARPTQPGPFSERAHFGGSLVGPPGDTTWLRIVKRNDAGEELYTTYTSSDGQRWVCGGTRTHNLGQDAHIGLVSMGGSGFTADFDYVRVYRLNS